MTCVSQRFALARAPFALEIAARNAAGSVKFFLIVDGQRQEVDAFLRLLGGDHRRQHRGLAVGRNNRAVGLARYLPGLERERTSAPIQGDTMNVKHGFLSWFRLNSKAMSKTARGCSARPH